MSTWALLFQAEGFATVRLADKSATASLSPSDGAFTNSSQPVSFIRRLQVLTSDALSEMSQAKANLSAAAPEKPDSSKANREVLFRSFFVVAVAEMFDKTWFVALICAMTYGRQIAFIASFAALGLHVLLAAALGVAISKFFSISTLCFTTAFVFGVLASLYFYEFLQAKSEDDAIAERSDEAKEAMSTEQGTGPWDRFLRIFFSVFVAEWGDRTQVAMVTLHSSYPWVPVCLGSLVAFFLLTLSAVAAASLLKGTKLSEKLVVGLSAFSFLIFALMSLRDGVIAAHSATKV